MTLQKIECLPDIASIRAKQEELLSSKKSLSLGAFEGDKLCGAIGVMSIREGHPWVEHCSHFGAFVRKALWGNGIASALLEEAHHFSDSNEITRIEATVRSNNPRALALYVKHGYKVEGRRTKAAVIDGKPRDEFYIARTYPSPKRQFPQFEISPEMKLVPLFSTMPAKLLAYYQRNKEHLIEHEAQRSKDFYSKEYWIEAQSQAIAEFSQQSALRLALENHRTKSIAGVLNYSQISRGAFNACYLGFSLDKKVQGKGLMEQSLRASINYMFEDWKLHRIMANHFPENLKSAKLLDKLGFKVEGTAKDYLYLGGKWREHTLRALHHPKLTPA